MPTTTHEVNFDGLVGPTHNYAGLSRGNLASMAHQAQVSSPRDAALQGLAKMKFLADLGLKQAVLPPHERPAIRVLKRLGFSGTDAEILRRASAEAPETLAACASGSAMWTANAATAAAATDAADGRVHLTPANLSSKFHRAIEVPATERILHAVFGDAYRFSVHPPLEGGPAVGDEGAANHTRLAPSHSAPGLHLFVYGHSYFNPHLPRPARFEPRQSLEASQAVARLHQLDPARVVFAQQNPAAIDAGVFHADVILTGNENLLVFHEAAFLPGDNVVAELRRRFRRLYGEDLHTLAIAEAEIPLADAVASYLFNSQIVTLAPGRMALIAPGECQAVPRVHAWIEALLADANTPLREAYYFDLRQSMRNGGGPACLRQRVWLDDDALARVHPGVFINDTSYPKLVAWVKQHYRERLVPEDLADPALLDETRRALDELTQLLGLGSVYRFQLAGA